MVTEAQDGNLAALLSDYNLGEGVMTGLEAIFAVRIGAARNFPCVLLTAVSEDVIAREGDSAVHEEPKADRTCADTPPPCCYLRICVGSPAAALPADCGSTFRIGDSAGRSGTGSAGKLLRQKAAAG